MAVWLALGAVLLVLASLAGAYVSRSRTLSGRVGSFTCGLRVTDGDGGGWAGGIAQYGAGRLLWWRTRSLLPRPARQWSRADLTLLDRVPTGEVDDRGQPMLRVVCSHREETFQLFMSVAACAGLVSWLEAGPRPVGRVI